MRRLIVALVCIAGLVAVAMSAAQPRASARLHWTITDLGTPGHKGEQSEAVAINARGQVVGRRYVVLSTDTFATVDAGRAFLWERGRMRSLPTLGRPDPSWPPRIWSGAAAINDRGQVAGKSTLSSGAPRAVVWTRGQPAALGVLRGGTATWSVAIDERGDVAGVGTVASGSEHAFLWRDGRLRDLGTLGGARSEAAALNARGAVVGWSDRRCAGDCVRAPFLWQGGRMLRLGSLSSGGPDLGPAGIAIDNRGEVAVTAETRAHKSWGPAVVHAFRWRAGMVTDLDPLHPRIESSVVAINRSGDIVGNRGPDLQGKPYRAFLWRKGTLTDLGSLAGPQAQSEAAAVNGSGDVVGSSWVPGKAKGTFDTHGFVWHGPVMTDLGTLPGGTESHALAVNDRGQIVGWATTKSGAHHAVLWSPVTDSRP